MNDRKLEALLRATMDDMEKAETAVLRQANDQYRKIIFNAQVYANSGAGTYEKAVDMATKDFLAAGLNCVQYANGTRHTLSDYADMAIRTAAKRAYLQGEGQKRQEWGIHTVIVNKRGNPCPKCLPFCGKVLIDDVWSGGSRKDGPYPLMSSAVAAGLYHPRCKDSHTTYFPGISAADDTWTKEEVGKIGLDYQMEQKKQYVSRQVEKYDRLAMYSLDQENQKRYAARREEWKKRRKAESEPQTISDVNKIGTKKLAEAYEHKRIANNLNLSPAGTFMDKMPDVIKVDYGDIDFKAAKGFDRTISKLVDEYNTPLQKIVPMGKEEAFFQKSVPASTSINYSTYAAEMRINQIILKDNAAYIERVKKNIQKGQFPDIPDKLADQYVPTHEFAHTLLSTKDRIPTKKNWAGMDFGNIKKARTEIKDLYQSYSEDMGRLKSEKDSLYKKFFDGSISEAETKRLRKIEEDIKKLKISDYAAQDADEFLAEAFTDAKLGVQPSEYSKKVLDIIDRNFKRPIAKDSGSDIIKSGARITNPFSKEAEKFAEMYYPEIRKFSTDVKKIAEHLGKSERDIKKIKAYLFEEASLFDSDTGIWRRFDPDCSIAQSWQRLMIGKDIKPHDRTLIEHELLEMRLKERNPGISHDKAHELASQKYNYQKEADEYYGSLEKYKKE